MFTGLPVKGRICWNKNADSILVFGEFLGDSPKKLLVGHRNFPSSGRMGVGDCWLRPV